MYFVLKEAKFTIHKSQNDMARYYNQQCTSALVFNPGDKMFLKFSDIHTMLYPILVTSTIIPENTFL